MPRPCHAFLGLALLLAMLGNVRGQSQPQSPRQDSPSSQQQPNADPRGTEQAPFIVQLQIPAQIVEGKPDSKTPPTTNSGGGLAGWFSWVKSWTVSDKIAAIALVAFCVQAWYMRASARQVRRTTDDQLAYGHQIERAYMSIGGVPEKHIVERTFIGADEERHTVRDVEPTGRFEVHLNNHGKTTGELMNIAIDFCDADVIPSQPAYDPQPFHDWIGPGTQSRLVDWRDIPNDRPASAVYGRVYYRDIFGKDHSAGFIQSISPDGGTAPLLAPLAYTASD
jgi:hypothetical protein